MEILRRIKRPDRSTVEGIRRTGLLAVGAVTAFALSRLPWRRQRSVNEPETITREEWVPPSEPQAEEELSPPEEMPQAQESETAEEVTATPTMAERLAAPERRFVDTQVATKILLPPRFVTFEIIPRVTVRYIW